MTKLNIAVDYDNTYTADPQMWHELMNIMLAAGHNVFIVTYRDERFDTDDTLTFIQEDGFDVYYTRGVAKKWWIQQFAPWEHKAVNIWIDDNPDAILNNSGFSYDDLNVWRNEQGLAVNVSA